MCLVPQLSTAAASHRTLPYNSTGHQRNAACFLQEGRPPFLPFQLLPREKLTCCMARVHLQLVVLLHDVMQAFINTTTSWRLHCRYATRLQQGPPRESRQLLEEKGLLVGHRNTTHVAADTACTMHTAVPAAKSCIIRSKLAAPAEFCMDSTGRGRKVTQSCKCRALFAMRAIHKKETHQSRPAPLIGHCHRYSNMPQWQCTHSLCLQPATLCPCVCCPQQL
jgi:hypothetical protein